MKMKVELDNGTKIELEGTQPELEHMLPACMGGVRKIKLPEPEPIGTVLSKLERKMHPTKGNLGGVFHPPKHKYKHHTWRAKLGTTLTSALKASNVSADNKEIKSFLQANSIPATKKRIRRVYARLIWMRWKKRAST